MKITAILLLTTCLQVSATGKSQTVTLDLKNTPVKKVFKEVIRQTGMSILYDVQLFNDDEKVTIKVVNAPVDDVLGKCLSGLPFSYTITGGTIVIARKLEQVPSPSEKGFRDEVLLVDIKGHIVNEAGDPVPAASVLIKGTKQGTITNSNGEFTLLAVPESATLIFSGTNIETFEMPCSAFQAGVVKELTAKIKVSSLNEVIINKGYYTEKQKLSVSNVGRITAKDIEKQPVNNPLLAVQGRVPGIVITQNSGLPGAGINVQIQGKITIGSLIGVDPLYVIDGVPYPSRSLYNLSSIQQSPNGSSPDQGGISPGSGSPLSFINPADIESIEILKDADATAIYGSRAGNGAILITTKKGKAGKTKVSFNTQTGIGKVANFFDVLNREQYLAMRHEGFANDNATPTSTAYDLNGTWDTTRSTNWQKVLIGGAAHYTDLAGDVSGGNANTQFLLGAGYHKETSVFPGDMNDQRGSMHFNINNVSLNQKFRLQFSGSYMLDDNKLMTDDLTPIAVAMSPVAPALYTADGSLNWAPLANGNATWTNPLAYLYNQYSNKTNNLISNLEISYQFFKDINIKSSFGYNNLQSEQYRGFPLVAVKPQNRPTASRRSDFSNSTISTWIIEPSINYKHKFGQLEVNGLAGATFMDNNNIYESQSGSGYTNDLFLKNISAASTKSALSSSSRYKYNAAFSRLSGVWNDKYILNLTARRDGSSRFGSENLFHNFWSVGGGWIFSKESFIADKLSFISFGKIRASYGTTGNDQIGDYKYLNLYNNITGVGVAYQNATGVTPNGLPNPYLQWEETKKFQVGLDLGLIKDRIILNTSYFQNRSSNQLLAYQLPIMAGFSSITRNFPATIQNSGWELALNTTNIKKEHFTWSSIINITIPKNKLLKFPGIETSSYANTYTVGKPVTITRVYHSLGVNPTTGVYVFQAASGSTTSQPTTGDLTESINTAPKFFGGIQNSLSYKGFQLDIFFQYMKQMGPNNFIGNSPGRLLNDGTGNQPISVLNRWQRPGDITTVQRFYAVSNSNYSLPAISTYGSDAIYSDASYIRLKNASVSWQIPEKWKCTIRSQDLKIYVQGENLFTITKFKNLDPETLSNFTLPPLRIITVGIHASF